MKWKVNDRVTREVYMDDGTWERYGDTCLADSPLRHGTVVAISLLRPTEEVVVQWDDGTVGMYLEHGIEAEVSN